MRTKNIIKTIKTVCGKTLTYLQTEGEINKLHNTEGPAVIYPESENTSPEYYLHGIKYTKSRWKELIAQYKVTPVSDTLPIDPDN